MTELTAPIVGMHFRPPAKDVVSLLPPNTRVLLRREPTNEYDEFAVQVLLPGFNPESPSDAGQVFRTLAESGNYGEDILFEETTPGVFDKPKDPLHLAFVDSKKTGMARMFSQAMQMEERQYQQSYFREDQPNLLDKLLLFEAKLTFDFAGKPQVVTELQVAEDQYEEDRAEGLEIKNEDDDEEPNFMDTHFPR